MTPIQRAVEPMERTIESLRSTRADLVREQESLGLKIAAVDSALAALGSANLSPQSSSFPSNGRAKRGAILQAILQTLDKHGPVKPAVIVKHTGAKPTTISTSLANLQKRKLVVRGDNGWALSASGKERVANVPPF